MLKNRHNFLFSCKYRQSPFVSLEIVVFLKFPKIFFSFLRAREPGILPQAFHFSPSPDVEQSTRQQTNQFHIFENCKVQRFQLQIAKNSDLVLFGQLPPRWTIVIPLRLLYFTVLSENCRLRSIYVKMKYNNICGLCTVQ